MPIHEVFPNPTVKQVIFQVTYPNLFFLESKIGDLQLAIMERFKESKTAYRRFMFGDIGPDVKPEDIPKLEKSTAIWQFINPVEKVTLSVTTNSLDIVSFSHKTYNQGTPAENFRETIDYVLTAFLTLVSIPLVNRIGLRYIDECPLPHKTTRTLTSYYNTTFPTDRFRVEEAVDMLFKTTVSKKNHFITYIESLQKVGEDYKMILDFDSYASNVKASDLLTVLDTLHQSISDEFNNSIKEPVFKHMRGGK